MKIGTTDSRSEIQAQIDILKRIYRKEARVFGTDGSYADGYNQGVFDMSMEIAKIVHDLEDRLKQLELKKFKFYRLRHKPSGLFYTRARYMSPQIPNSGRYRLKSNMSEKGKVYHQKPQKPSKISTHVPIDGMKNTAFDGYVVYTKEEDWEIVGYD